MKTPLFVIRFFYILLLFTSLFHMDSVYSASFESCGQGQQIIQDLLKVIRSGDIKTILPLIDSKGGISWGGDDVLVYKDIEKDVLSKKGPLYCRLMGCKEEKESSVKSILSKIDDKFLKISCSQYMQSKDKKTTWYQVQFEWQGKKIENLGSLQLKKMNSRWYFQELFTD